MTANIGIYIRRFIKVNLTKQITDIFFSRRKESKFLKKHNSEKLEKKKLIQNFGHLAFLQILNIVFPMLTFPYVVKIVGIDHFGELSLTQSISSLAIIIINFGFDLSVTPEIAKNKDNRIIISKYFYDVLALKLILLIICVLVTITITGMLPTLLPLRILLLYSAGSVIGAVLFPNWLFQGMERMSFLTYFNLTGKILSLLLIFIFLREKSNYHLFLILGSILGIISGVIGFIFSIISFNIPFTIPTQKSLYSLFLTSKNYFLSRVANDSSRYLTTIIIGLNFSSSLVGYYAVIDKIFATSISIGGTGAQALYPLMSRKKDINIFLYVLKYTVLGSLIYLIILYVFKAEILSIIFNSNSPILYNIFESVLWCIIIANISSLIGFPLLGTYGFEKEANFSLVFASIFYLFYILTVVIFTKNILLTSISLCIYELVAFFIRIYYINKYQILKQ